MRAHLELTPAERRILTTLTSEERGELAAQMIETLAEELEWAVAVERANQAADAAQALVARAELAAQPIPIPPSLPSRAAPGNQRYRWPSFATAKR
jgi:hypothetical protein